MKDSLTRYAWLSVAAALTTMALKAGAWWLTGSVGLLSDALESLVNLAGALMAVLMLAIAARPADAEHAHGHGKAEYFSSAFEGALILCAAVGIGGTALHRLLDPQPLAALGLGLLVSLVASVVNLLTAVVIRRAGQRHRSVTLAADAQHLLTDVWTSAGVMAGVGLVALTGWLWLDPLIALAVAGYIVHTGWTLVRHSADGLMDASLPDAEVARINAALDEFRGPRVNFHALRTRQAGQRTFVTLHALVPGAWSVQQAHDLSETIEGRIRAAVPGANVTVHIEPIEDPAAHADQALDRPD